MSFGDFEYQESTSATLARLLKGIRQEQVILDAVQNPIDDLEEFPDARQVESVKGTKDHIGAVVHPVSKSWHFANEPNENTRLWLWFREGWRLRDYSRHGNDAFADQLEPAPYPVENYVPLRRRITDDLTTAGRLYGIIDGKSQYYRVEDGPDNRITDLLVTNNTICFSVFFSPYQTYILDDDDCATVFQKLDDDQSSNAVRVCVEVDGKVTFSMVYQGLAYELVTAAGVAPVLETPEFIPGQFIDGEFLTQSTKPWQWNPDINPTDWTWLFFTFDKVSKQLKIYKVADGGYTATLLVSSTDETGMLANVSMWIPANEGQGVDATTAYDITSNNNDAVFAASPDAPDFSTDGYLHFVGDTKHANVSNTPSINTLTTFTIAFKVRLHSYATGGIADFMLVKDRTNTTLGNGGFEFSMNSSGSSTMFFDCKNNSGVARGLTFTGAIASLNTWYNVIVTYNGTQYAGEAGAVTATPLSASGDTLTNSNPVRLGHTGRAFQGDIADVVIVKGEAWNTTKKNIYKAKTPAYKALFPAWKPPKPPEPETPLPVVRPVEKVYEVLLTDGTAETVNINTPALTSPFVSIYNVPGGTPATTPEVLQYDVADGTTGGGGTVPISTIYNLAAASSTGAIDSDETAYVQRIDDTSSVLYNKKPTDLQFWINDSGGDCNGMAYPAIIRTNGTYTKIGAGMSVTALTSTWVSISGVSYVDRTALAVGDGVGIVREGHSSGTLGVRRGGTDTHYDNAGGTIHSHQNLLVGTTFTTDNDQYSIAGVVKVGGEPISGSNPYYPMDLTNWAVSNYQINSTLENIAPSKIQWRVKRVGSAASATVVCRIRNAAGALLYTYPQTINFNTIGTTVQNIEFSDVNQTVQWVDGYRINLEFAVLTGINDTTNYLDVNYNTGTGSGAIGGTAIKAQYYRGNVLTGYADVTPVSDWAGKIYTGGASFTAYKEFSPTTFIIAEKVNSSTAPASKLFGLKHSKLTATLKKSGSPVGPINVKVWDNAGTEKAIFNTVIDASSLTTSDSTYVFTFPLNNYVAALNDRVGLQYGGSTSTDKVLVKINTDAAAGAPADTTKSILSSFPTGGPWVDEPTLDLAVEIFTGGVPDTTSKPKAAIRCDSIFSRIYQDKITRAVIPVRKLGAPTGTYYIRSVRGSDGSNRDLLGSGDISSLSTTTYLYKDVSNYTAIHHMGETDKIVIEFEGGDPSNCLQVQVNKASTYDDEDTRFESFDGINWNTEGFGTWDMAATLYTGGDTYIPDAGTPYVEPPDYYDHDLLIGTGAFVAEEHTSFFGMRVRDFKIETSVPTLGEMDTLYDNKYSRRGGAGEVALAGYSTFNSETEPPPV